MGNLVPQLYGATITYEILQKVWICVISVPPSMLSILHLEVLGAQYLEPKY